MDSSQDGLADFLHFMEPSMEMEHPTCANTVPEGFSGVTENQTTRIFLNALKERPDIWKSILSQKQVPRKNPGWEIIRAECNLRDVDDARKYFESIKKDMMRRIDKAFRNNVISVDLLEVEGLGIFKRLRQSQNKYKYWGDADFLAKHIILQRKNFDLDNMPPRTNLFQSMSDVKTEISEDDQNPGTFAEISEDQYQNTGSFAVEMESTATVVDEELSSYLHETPEDHFLRTNSIQSIKQEKVPSNVAQMQTCRSSPDKPDETSVTVENTTNLISVKQERHDIDDGDSDNDQTQVRLIMSGIECSNDSGNLQTSMEEEEDVDMDVYLDLDELREEMSRISLRLWEKICVLPSEKRMTVINRLTIFGHKLKTLASQEHQWCEIEHELQAFEF